MTWVGENSNSGVMYYSEDGSPGNAVGSNGQLFAWQNGLPSFVNQSAITGVAPASLNQIGDVDTSGVVTGDNLTWDGVKWAPASVGSPFNSVHTYGQDVNESFTSTEFVAISGASGVLTTQTETAVVCWFMFDADSGAGGGETLEIRVTITGVIDDTVGEFGVPFQRDLSGASDVGIGVAFGHLHGIPADTQVAIYPEIRSVGGGEVRILDFHTYAMTEEGTIGPTGPTGPSGAQGAAGADGTVPSLDTLAAIWLYTTSTSGAGLPTSPTDLHWDEVHEVTKPLELNRDATNTSRVNINSSGLYAVSYSLEGEQSAQLVNIAAFINGVEHPGTRTTGGEYHHPQAHEYFINRIFLHTFTSGDYLQIKFWESSTDSATVDSNANLMVWRLEGYQGPAGVAGADGVDGSGDLTGPGSSTIRAIPVFNDTTGKLIASTDVLISESGHVTNAKTYTYEIEFDNGNSGASATINWSESQKQKITLNAATPTLTFVDPSGVGNFLLKLVQDGTGGRDPTWPSTVKWPGGTKPDLAASTGNQTDIATFYYDGGDYYGVGSLDFY